MGASTPPSVNGGSSPSALSVAQRSRRASGFFLLAGLLAGVAVLLEYTSAIALVPLAVYALARAERPRWRAALAGVIGFAPPILALAAYHQAAFGSPFATGYSHLDNAVYTSWHARGFMGVGAPTLQALRGSFVDPARGLFAWAPFLALGVPGLFVLWAKDRALTLLCAAEVVLYAWFTTSFTYQSWGWTVGPRHIVTACAFLIPPALAAADRLRATGLGFIGAGLALLGMAVLALTLAFGPYIPDDLTNPVHQLVVPLVRRGFRSPDLLTLALHARSWWTLLPWIAALGLAAAALVPLSCRPADEPGAMQSALAGAVAALLFAGHSHLGGADRFDETRRFMRQQFEEAAAVSPRSRRLPGPREQGQHGGDRLEVVPVEPEAREVHPERSLEVIDDLDDLDRVEAPRQHERVVVSDRIDVTLAPEQLAHEAQHLLSRSHGHPSSSVCAARAVARTSPPPLHQRASARSPAPPSRRLSSTDARPSRRSSTSSSWKAGSRPRSGARAF